MKYIDIHTHQKYHDENVVSIWNQFVHHSDLPYDKPFSLSAHPWFLDKIKLVNQLSDIYSSPFLLAIGECGLDKITPTDWSFQIETFEAQRDIANQLQKPLIIHCVRAVDECIKLLASAKTPVLFHGVNFSFEKVKKILDKGYYVSIGTSLYSKNSITRHYLHQIPLDQLFLETDDSTLHIQEIYSSAKEILKIPAEQLNLQLQNNFETFIENSHARY